MSHYLSRGYPAHAGIDLTRDAPEQNLRLPRTRGDRPLIQLEQELFWMRLPRTRGDRPGSASI
jgi:hypothetical protein